MHPLGRAAAFRHLMHLELMHAPLAGEQQQVLMVGGGQKILHEIVIGSVQAGNSLAAALLLLIGRKRGALDVAGAATG